MLLTAPLVLIVGMVSSLSAQGSDRTDRLDAGVGSSDQPLATFAPTAGFDPLTASNAELAQNGFPPRPASGPHLAAWDATFGQATNYVPPNPIQGTTVVAPSPALSSPQPASSSAGIPVDSLKWSGYYISGESNYAQSEWIQKPVKAGDDTNFQTSPMVTFWAGMGGVEDDYIIQAGAASISAYPVAQYRFWTEDAPNPVIWEGPVIRPDDDAFVYVQYENNFTTQYFLEDVTTGDYSVFTNSSPDLDIYTTDFVAEAPFDVWPDWGTTTFYYNYNGSVDLSPDNGNEVILESDTGVVRGQPGAINPENAGFDDSWKHS